MYIHAYIHNRVYVHAFVFVHLPCMNDLVVKLSTYHAVGHTMEVR